MSIKSTLGLEPAAPLAVEKYEAVLQQNFIIGCQYYDLAKVKTQLKVGQQLFLQREPYNQFDAHAVAVYWKKYKLGFVPRDYNYCLATLMDQQVKMTAWIVEIRPNTDYWEKILMQIHLQGIKR